MLPELVCLSLQMLRSLSIHLAQLWPPVTIHKTGMVLLWSRNYLHLKVVKGDQS